MNSFNESRPRKFQLVSESNPVVLGFKDKMKKKVSYGICNICNEPYVVGTKFDRFCTDCKDGSELYHFHEWLSA